MIEVKNTLEGKLNVSVVKEYPELEEITITPTLDGKELEPSKYGYSKITVKPIPATDVTVAPSEEQQNLKGIFKEVNINPIQVEEITTDLDFGSSDAIELEGQEGTYIKKATINKPTNLVPENIKSGETVCGISGTMKSDAELISSFISSVDNTLGKNVTKLPDGITVLGAHAFYKCTNLAIKKLPDSIKNIGKNCFTECTGLTELETGGTYISENAFHSCTNLTKLTVKGNTLSIQGAAFYSCSKLKAIILPNLTSIGTLYSGAFNSSSINSKTGFIYVPDNMVDTVKNATDWKNFASQIKAISELEG